MLIGTSAGGTPVYLRDLVPRLTRLRQPTALPELPHAPRRARAVAAKPGGHPGADDALRGAGRRLRRWRWTALEHLRRKLPPDLIMARTTDQPRQVERRTSRCSWPASTRRSPSSSSSPCSASGTGARRSSSPPPSPSAWPSASAAMLMLGIDIQQVSIATLIIALGLLVDMPVVAGDAIKRELAQGQPESVAAWIGPTQLARAIFFATLTNIVAYLPFLMLTGDTGWFLHSLPIVMTTTLVAAFIVSFSFIPLIAFGLIKPPKQRRRPSERPSARLHRLVLAHGRVALQHRLAVLRGLPWSSSPGAASSCPRRRRSSSPRTSRISPTSTSGLRRTPRSRPRTRPRSRRSASSARWPTIRQAPQHQDVLAALTSFVGGAGPRFWFSIEPEQQQLNYAQIIVEVTDKHFTKELVGPIQTALSRQVPGGPDRRPAARDRQAGRDPGLHPGLRGGHRTFCTISPARSADPPAQPPAARVRDNWGGPDDERRG